MIMNYTIPDDDGEFFFDPVIAKAALDLWTDDIMPVLMEHSSEFYLMDTAS